MLARVRTFFRNVSKSDYSNLIIEFENLINEIDDQDFIDAINHKIIEFRNSAK